MRKPTFKLLAKDAKKNYVTTEAIQHAAGVKAKTTVYNYLDELKLSDNRIEVGNQKLIPIADALKVLAVMEERLGPPPAPPAPVAPAAAAPKHVPDEVRSLRTKLALLTEKVDMQGRDIDALRLMFEQLAKEMGVKLGCMETVDGEVVPGETH